jgi:hypothetical protein
MLALLIAPESGLEGTPHAAIPLVGAVSQNGLLVPIAAWSH